MESNGMLESAAVAEKPCVLCGSPNVMTIRMAFEGSPVTVQVCSDCDAKIWNRGGEHVEVDGLFESMKSTTRRR